MLLKEQVQAMGGYDWHVEALFVWLKWRKKLNKGMPCEIRDPFSLALVSTGVSVVEGRFPSAAVILMHAEVGVRRVHKSPEAADSACDSPDVVFVTFDLAGYVLELAWEVPALEELVPAR